MRLTLHYRGSLRANGNPAHKHDIRKAFHAQLKTLWLQKPLTEMPELLVQREQGEYCLLRPLANYMFAPLVTAEMDATAELSVTLLRPEAPGSLLTQGGDIDNRLKTLFDALTMPRHENSLPNALVLRADEQPFFCLLEEDDNLVTSVQVRTEQLLEPVDDTLVDLSIFVRTRITRSTWGNDFLA